LSFSRRKVWGDGASRQIRWKLRALLNWPWTDALAPRAALGSHPFTPGPRLCAAPSIAARPLGPAFTAWTLPARAAIARDSSGPRHALRHGAALDHRGKAATLAHPFANPRSPFEPFEPALGIELHDVLPVWRIACRNDQVPESGSGSEFIPLRIGQSRRHRGEVSPLYCGQFLKGRGRSLDQVPLIAGHCGDRRSPLVDQRPSDSPPGMIRFQIGDGSIELASLVPQHLGRHAERLLITASGK
jgi:hypothetical protein